MRSADTRAGLLPGSSVVMVLVLTLAMTISYGDRFVLNLVIEPIKRDLALSDTAVALVQGFAFSMFFVVSGVPIGVLVDRTRRLTIIAIGVLAWSLATSACGLVTGFGGLLACRTLVAIGEATLSPAAFSIFADILPRRRLGLGIGIFSLGIYLGAGLALLGGAAFLAHVATSGGISLPLLGHLNGWQALFVLVGLPGLPVALWIALLREPPRIGTPQDLARPSLADVVAFAAGDRRVLVSLFLCAGFAAVTSQAYAAWMPSFLVRTFGWSVPQAGGLSGLVIIAGGLPGVLVAGLVGDALRRRGLPNGRLFVMIGSALALMWLSMFFVTVLLTSAAPAIQELLPNRMQGTIVALYALVVTLVGLGLGPLAVALVTDHVLHDERRLGVALACIALASISAASAAGWVALRPYAARLAARHLQ